MKRTIFLTVLTIGFAFGAVAQVTPQNTSGTAVPQPQDSRALTFPYINQGAYSSMDINNVPQNIQSSFGADYAGVTGARWEYNNDVYRSSFMQDGKSRSVIYGRDGRAIEMRTGTTMSELPAAVQNALKGQNASSPYEIRIGEHTYYSTQIGGKETYYDANGNALKTPEPGQK